MATEHLLDSELLPIAELPAFKFTRDKLPDFRTTRAQAIDMDDASEYGVRRESVSVPGPDYDVPCLLYVPEERRSRAGYLHIHGGGSVSYTHLTLPTNREV